jgi:hypothetical protein
MRKQHWQNTETLIPCQVQPCQKNFCPNFAFFWCMTHNSGINDKSSSQTRGYVPIRMCCTLWHGCAIAQAVSHWLLTVEAQVHTQGSPCVIFGGQSGTRAGFPQSSLVFPCKYHSTTAPYSCTIWGLDSGPISGNSSIESITPLQQ